MRKLITGALAVLIASPAPHHHVEPRPRLTISRIAALPFRSLVSAPVMKAWNRVYLCETHNWRQQGTYEGGLGITLWNWQHHGGLRFAKAPYLATAQQQVWVALRIQHGLPTPDQRGACRDW